MTVRRNVARRRLVRDLHGAMGIWLLLSVLFWAITGIYFAFPEPFNDLTDIIVKAGASSLAVDDAVAWIVRLHFGRAFGHGAEVLWAIGGLLPRVLVITGVVTWWHRVRPWGDRQSTREIRRLRQKSAPRLHALIRGKGWRSCERTFADG
jgi:uncharacterized iron-regulated membrane protein